MKGKTNGRYNWDENFEFCGYGFNKDYGDRGKIKFEGELLNGERNGKGKEYDENGFLIFEGEYLNGERNGKGNEYHDYDKNGNVLYEIKNGKGWKKEYNSYDILKLEGEYSN